MTDEGLNKAIAKKDRGRIMFLLFSIIAIPPAAYFIGVFIGDRLEEAIKNKADQVWHTESKARNGGIVRE
jgi:hypothetical protein